MFKWAGEKLGEGSRLGLDLSVNIARTLSFPDQLDGDLSHPFRNLSKVGSG